MTSRSSSAGRPYRSAYPGIPRGPWATMPVDCDTATDWPDFSDRGEPIHLDTCRVMSGDDTYCTCGLTLLQRAGAMFTMGER